METNRFSQFEHLEEKIELCTKYIQINCQFLCMCLWTVYSFCERILFSLYGVAFVFIFCVTCTSFLFAYANNIVWRLYLCSIVCILVVLLVAHLFVLAIDPYFSELWGIPGEGNGGQIYM